MEYYSGKRYLKRIGEVLSNNTNEVCICEETDTRSKIYYMLWIVKDRMLARTLLKVFHEKNETPLYLETFAINENTAFVFPYNGERSLFRFLGGELLTQKEQEKIWRQLVETCMASDIPYAILFQLLRQHRLQIQPDGEITFSYALDLRNFQVERAEEDCADMCAEIILELMEMSKSGNTRLKRVLQSKFEEEERHYSFGELFQDIISNAKAFKFQKNEKQAWKKLSAAIKGSKDKILKILVALCLILIVIAVVLMLSQFIYGEIPLLRLFQNSFQTIGTESLVQ